MNLIKAIRAIVFARNCEDSRSFSILETEYRSRSPPVSFGFYINKFKT